MILKTINQYGADCANYAPQILVLLAAFAAVIAIAEIYKLAKR